MWDSGIGIRSRECGTFHFHSVTILEYGADDKATHLETSFSEAVRKTVVVRPMWLFHSASSPPQILVRALTPRPTLTKTDHCGRVLPGHNGGVWEWTSTPFAGYEGFEPSELYPGYSGDFFDNKHYVVVSLHPGLSLLSFLIIYTFIWAQ